MRERDRRGGEEETVDILLSFSPNNNVKHVQSRTSSRSDHSCTTAPNVTGVVIVDVGHKPYLQSHQVVADTSIYIIFVKPFFYLHYLCITSANSTVVTQTGEQRGHPSGTVVRRCQRWQGSRSSAYLVPWRRLYPKSLLLKTFFLLRSTAS